MRYFLQIRFLLGLGVATAVAARADVSLAPPFQDHAVLQRDRALPVWGHAAPGERVSVTFAAGAPVTAVTDADGRWQVMLPPHPANLRPAELVVQGVNRIVVRDVLVGEVWLCSGQSNMEFRLKFAASAEPDIAAADFPLIRQLKVERHPRPMLDETVAASWMPYSPATAGEFTAVGYYFARDLWQALHVPIGIINSAHGSSPVEAWLSAATLARDPAFGVVMARAQKVLAGYPAAKAHYDAALVKWEAAVADSPRGAKRPSKPALPPGPEGHHQLPSNLYNGMIHPLVPYAVRGFVWYQGESNARRAAEYERLFTALVREWRTEFQVPDAPFFWVQLPALGRMPPATTETDWVALRAAQTAALALPATGQAISIDVGDPTNIHPKRKAPVGERLARLARHRVYGEAVEDSGPELATATAIDGGVRLTFSPATGGLVLRGDVAGSFEVAGPNGEFRPARTAERVGEGTLVLREPSIAQPVQVRYAWHGDPQATVFNHDGLPAAPFEVEVK